jgi:hypothetical protein
MRISILLSSLIILLLFSCKKYDDDHFLRLRTAKNRIEGTWRLNEIELIDGTVIRNINSEYLIFSRNGEYIIQKGGFTVLGSWSFTDGKESIYTRVQQFGFTKEKMFNIQKLSNNRMTLLEKSGTLLRYRGLN